MCRLLGVTRSGYYGYQQRQDNQPPDYYHQELIEAVKDIAKASDDSYGSRRMKMAVWQRRPESGLIVHSDRGSQYASRNYRRLLKAHGFVGSMSRKGDCWGDYKSFFGSLKQERVQRRNDQTRYEAQQDVLHYISMWYNTDRLHSYLGYKSPAQYESEMMPMKKVA